MGANGTATPSPSSSGGAPREGQGRVRITADTTTNSLLIFADQETSSMIFKVIEQIDRPRLQVAIEATIAEVTLNNSLQYGVQYYLKNNVGSIGLATSKAADSSLNTAPLLKTLPGFNLLLGSEADPKAILTALSGRTNVKVLSTPSLVVLDNQVATLQVGDQVPVSTTQAMLVNGNTNNGFPVANNIDYRNTGVILRVLPRVAANGNVTLDVDQEISNVANPTTSTLTPTISQRRVKSSIAVSSGQTVLLAGLISDREQADREGVPWLERIVLLGDLFANNTSTLNRTELIIFIKPQIIHDAIDAQAIAEEMRAKMTAKPNAN
jgi:general secretion pathway protein D